MKIKNQSAVVQRKNRIPFDIRHITTLGVSDIRVTGIVKMEQNDRIFGNISQFSRLSPLVAPTFGNFNIRTHAFWVPLRTIWHHYGEYVGQSVDSTFNSIKSPINFNLAQLWTCLKHGSYLGAGDYVDYVGQDTNLSTTDYDNCDLRVIEVDANNAVVIVGYNFTALGRMVWNNLQSLGYGLPQMIFALKQSDSGATGYAAANTLFPGGLDEYLAYNYNIYPLLALGRVFYDWIYPSAYVTQQGFGYLFTDQLYTSWFGYPSETLSHIFDMLINCYDREFYTSLWQTPNRVAAGSQGNISTTPLNVIIAENGQGVSNGATQNVRSGDSGTVSVPLGSNGVLNQNFQLTDVSLRWLEHISDYVLRNNIGGTRVRDYFKSHFGYTPSSILDDQSSHIRTFTSPVTIQDVTNMAAGTVLDGSGNQTNNVLGEQGGKGLSSGASTIKFEASEAGFILFVSCVVPSVGYYQGQKQFTRAINSPFDIYHADFDGVGMVGVPRRSLFSQYRTLSDFAKVPLNTLKNVLGYAPNYAEKKIGYDFLTGDFLLNSRNRGLDSYHTFRDVLYGRSNLAIDRQFMTVDNQTQRIFAYTGQQNDQGLYEQYDKIFTFFSFSFTRYTDQKSLSESMPFFNKEGKDVDMEYEGTQL